MYIRTYIRSDFFIIFIIKSISVMLIWEPYQKYFRKWLLKKKERFWWWQREKGKTYIHNKKQAFRLILKYYMSRWGFFCLLLNTSIIRDIVEFRLKNFDKRMFNLKQSRRYIKKEILQKKETKPRIKWYSL